MEQLLKWLNENASAVQAASAVVSVVVTAILVLITRGYAGETKKYRIEAEKSRAIGEQTLTELKRQHLDHQTEYQEEKEEQRKACVIPIQWRLGARVKSCGNFFESDILQLFPC